MRDRGTIITGLVVFLALVTFPIWYGMAAGADSRPPEIKLPEGDGKCVADTEYMRKDHMELLNRWRDDVVRNDNRIFVASDGRRYYKSLSRTCMSCHHDKAGFCDRCHDYVAVSPYCWDCHVDPKGGQ